MEETGKLKIFDGHNDTFLMLYAPGKTKRPFLEESDSGHIDLPRARMGGLCGGFFALFVPHPKETRTEKPSPDDKKSCSPPLKEFKSVDHPYALQLAQKGVESISALAAGSEGRLRVARSTEDIYSSLEQDALSIVIHFEGAEPIDSGLKSLKNFYDSGLRSLGIVWNRTNAFGHGVDFHFPGSPDMGPGLTDAGKELVRACNRLGIVVDLSHLNEKGFRDVERISEAPLVATHSCVHSICPSPRNLTDKQLDAIGASGGIVGINFGVMFIRKDGKRKRDTPLSDMVRHFAYVAERIGVDHVAMGSDFDGTTISNEIGDVRGLPRLVDALSKIGFNQEELERIAFKNWMRLLSHTWKG